MYEVEYADVYRTAMTENAITNNFLAQVNQDRKPLVLSEKTIDHRTNGTDLKEEDALIHMKNVTKSRT